MFWILLFVRILFLILSIFISNQSQWNQSQWDFWYSRWWVWSYQSSGILRRVVLWKFEITRRSIPEDWHPQLNHSSLNPMSNRSRNYTVCQAIVLQHHWNPSRTPDVVLSFLFTVTVYLDTNDRLHDVSYARSRFLVGGKWNRSMRARYKSSILLSSAQTDFYLHLYLKRRIYSQPLEWRRLITFL